MALAIKPYDEFWFYPHVGWGRARYVYVVYWPETSVIKAGVTNRPDRWRKFCRRGALLLAVFPGLDVSHEKSIEAEFALVGTPAFQSWQEAVPHLGAGGCGYTECYRIEPDSLDEITSYLEEVESALVQSGRRIRD